MVFLVAGVLAAELPYPVGSDRAPLTLPRPASGPVPAPTLYRVQQELVPPRSMGLTVLVQSDVRLSAQDRPDGRLWTARPEASAIDAWTDFGNVPDAELAAVAPPGTTWMERRDGTVADLEVDGPDNTSRALAEVFSGFGSQLRLATPDGPVAVGESWSRTQALDLTVPIETSTLRMRLEIVTTCTFLGWSEIDGTRVAAVQGAVNLRGAGLIEGSGSPHALSMWGRTGAWSWVDPVTGALVYSLAEGEMRQAVSATFDRPKAQVTRVRTSVARVGG